MRQVAYDISSLAKSVQGMHRKCRSSVRSAFLDSCRWFEVKWVKAVLAGSTVIAVERDDLYIDRRWWWDITDRPLA